MSHSRDTGHISTKIRLILPVFASKVDSYNLTLTEWKITNSRVNTKVTVHMKAPSLLNEVWLAECLGLESHMAVHVQHTNFCFPLLL